MAQDWYFTKGDTKHGPVSANKLKTLATTGQLQPSDMVWREGMVEWKEARIVKGLFSEATDNIQPMPPQLPSVRTSSVPPGVVAETSAPALWNPFALRAWSLLLTPAFGSFLMMKNWRSLGEEERAKRSMVWFWGTLGFLFLGLITPNTAAITSAFRFVGCVLFVVWATTEAEKQVRYIREKYGVDYTRKSWGKPLGIGAACILLPIMGAAGMLAESADVSLVKQGRLEAFPEVTVGQLVDNFLGSPTWSSDKTPDGQRIVNIKGQMTFMGKPVQAVIQFFVQDKRFELHAFEMNGIAQNNLVKASLFAKMYEQYKSTRPAKNDSSAKANGNPDAQKPQYDIEKGLPPAFELLLSGKPPEAIVEALGTPDIHYREPIPPRDSCRHLAAWKKSNGGFLMIAYLVRLHPVSQRLEIANITSNPGWNNMTLDQVEAHRGLVE